MSEQDISTIGKDYKAQQAQKEAEKALRKAQKQSHRTVEQTMDFKKLARAINGPSYIPYDKLLGPDGFMTDRMSVRITKRKREILEELSKIDRVASKYGIEM
jgi:hypothetical protein